MAGYFIHSSAVLLFQIYRKNSFLVYTDFFGEPDYPIQILTIDLENPSLYDAFVKGHVSNFSKLSHTSLFKLTLMFQIGSLLNL